MARSREAILASLRLAGFAERPLPDVAFAQEPLADPMGGS